MSSGGAHSARGQAGLLWPECAGHGVGRSRQGLAVLFWPARRADPVTTRPVTRRWAALSTGGHLCFSERRISSVKVPVECLCRLSCLAPRGWCQQGLNGSV